MMLNNGINSIIYRSSSWVSTGKMVFFEILALLSCQMRIRPKHLVTTCDFNNLRSKSVALQLAAIWKKKIIRSCFSRISGKKTKTSTFQNTFCWLLSLCSHHTALISNAFFEQNKDKRKRYSLAVKKRNGRFSVYKNWRRIW